tara:strand:- start:367 stop:561 length:195 start_codon:yes stop_codon:yes gene_type:complete
MLRMCQNYKKTDNQWELFGRKEPYFGVLSDAKYLSKNLTTEDKNSFFKSGFIYILKNNYLSHLL